MPRASAVATGMLLVCLASVGAWADQYHSQELVTPASTAGHSSASAMLEHTTDPYARAMLLRDLAGHAATQKDYKQAAHYLREALEQNALSVPAQALMRKQLTALLSANGDPRAVVKALEALEKQGKLSHQQQAALGSAYARLKRYDQAVPLLQAAVAASRNPPVAWLQTLAAAQLGAGQRKQALPTLQKWVAAAPARADAWLQLAHLQLELGQHKAALTTLQLAARLGYVDSPQQRMRIVVLLARNGVPFEAASLLQQAMKAGRIDATAAHWKTLGALWAQARERPLAITAFRQAIKLGASGDLHRQISQLALQMQDYATAVQALAKAGRAPATLLQL
ncbi:MAG: tetratricopeptide repeat protein, partial [Sinobacteraceae bacterium]|nr:tetratricopeptide repeat protein [Nevskiaceae bacterium]